MSGTVIDVSTKQQEILDRRAALLGETIEHPDKSITETIRDLSHKLHCSDRILWDDWACQEEWISDVFSLNVAYANKCVMFHENIKRLGMVAYRTGDNSNARVGGLRVAKEANNEIMELLYKLGVFTDSNDGKDIVIAWQMFAGDDPITIKEFGLFQRWRAQERQQDSSEHNKQSIHDSVQLSNRENRLNEEKKVETGLSNAIVDNGKQLQETPDNSHININNDSQPICSDTHLTEQHRKESDTNQQDNGEGNSECE